MGARSQCSFEKLFVDLEKLQIDINETFPASALKSVRIIANRRSCPVQYFTNSLAALFSNAMGDTTIMVCSDYIEVPAIWSLNLGKFNNFIFYTLISYYLFNRNARFRQECCVPLHGRRHTVIGKQGKRKWQIWAEIKTGACSWTQQHQKTKDREALWPHKLPESNCWVY